MTFQILAICSLSFLVSRCRLVQNRLVQLIHCPIVYQAKRRIQASYKRYGSNILPRLGAKCTHAVIAHREITNFSIKCNLHSYFLKKLLFQVSKVYHSFIGHRKTTRAKKVHSICQRQKAETQIFKIRDQHKESDNPTIYNILTFHA